MAESREICPWALSSDMMREYHDREWGRPLHDERTLFEFLILEGAQAGLSWRTILHKRARYREVFDGFDAEKIAAYTKSDCERLMADPGIVRNRLKIQAAMINAQAYLRLRDSDGGLDQWLWAHVGGKPVVNHWARAQQVPVSTDLSDQVSKGLRQRGFKFVGSTIIYAYLQAVGVVNDHLVMCPRHQACLAR